MESLIQAVVALLAIANPLGAAIVFSGLTEAMSPAQRRRAALRASAAVLAILTAAALAGTRILEAFGVSLPAFQVGGGLVIVLMGLEMLRGSPTRVQHETTPDDAQDSIFVPFAMPLVAGPGSITTVITLATRAGGWHAELDLLLAVVVTSGVLLGTLVISGWIEERVGERGLRIFLRFLGLILVALGAQFMLGGTREFLQLS